MTHKEGKWAAKLTALQQEDGSWGHFHSLAVPSSSTVTTEQALRRLERLGYTMADQPIRRAVDYMSDCLVGKNHIPDRAEKVHDWRVFTSMILSTWIRRFTPEIPAADEVARRWAAVVTSAYAGGSFDRDRYLSAYREQHRPVGGRIIGLHQFYPVSLLAGELDERTEALFLADLLSDEGGIYYIYDRRLATPPAIFQSRETSCWLGAIELLAAYPHAGPQLAFAVDWLEQNRKENGCWDLGPAANDKVYFPLSDSWRVAAVREADCTERISALLQRIKSEVTV